jgi:hypothetical protein
MKCWNGVCSSTAPRMSIWWPTLIAAGRSRLRSSIFSMRRQGLVSSGQVNVKDGVRMVALNIRGGANLVAYIGHNGLMDFQLPRRPKK